MIVALLPEDTMAHFNWEEAIRAKLAKYETITNDDVVILIKIEVARIIGMLQSYIEDDDMDLENVIFNIKKMYHPHESFEPIRLDLDNEFYSTLKAIADKNNCTIDFVIEQILHDRIGHGEL